jgi:hypothetical protein
MAPSPPALKALERAAEMAALRAARAPGVEGPDRSRLPFDVLEKEAG